MGRCKIAGWPKPRESPLAARCKFIAVTYSKPHSVTHSTAILSILMSSRNNELPSLYERSQERQRAAGPSVNDEWIELQPLLVLDEHIWNGRVASLEHFLAPFSLELRVPIQAHIVVC
jgi:hypothetical protein